MFGLNRISLPTVPEFNWMNSEGVFTPDLLNLEVFEKVNLFVYDSLQTGYPRYREYMARHSVRRWTAFSVDKFVTFKARLGKDSYPIPLPMTDAEAEAAPWRGRKKLVPMKIKGEIHEIYTERVPVLDWFKRNTEQFSRVRTNFVVPYTEILRTKDGQVVWGAERQALVFASMYVGIPDYWNDLIDDGFMFEPLRRFKYWGSFSSIKEYSYFDYNLEFNNK